MVYTTMVFGLDERVDIFDYIRSERLRWKRGIVIAQSLVLYDFIMKQKMIPFESLTGKGAGVSN